MEIDGLEIDGLEIDDQDLCRKCGKPIHWMHCPTGGWWAHEVHLADGHDAVKEDPV